MKALIVIPAYNEQEALPNTINNLQSLPDETYDLLVVNDGSDDLTGDLADQLLKSSKLRLQVIHLPTNVGVGPAMQTGYRYAARHGIYDYVIQFDADGQHDVGYVDALINACQTEKLDLCLGSRFLTDQEGFKSTKTRRIGIRFISWLISTLSGCRITDATGGFRCAGRRAWANFARYYPEDYAEPESLFWCARNKLKIGEIPVRMHERQGGVSSIHSFKAIYYMVKVSMAIIVDRLRRKEHLGYETES